VADLESANTHPLRYPEKHRLAPPQALATIMPEPKYNCPLSRPEVVDRYFLEHRAKLIDIAAFLDRVDRAEPQGEGEDFRMAAFREALHVLGSGESGRARRVLEHLSDPTTEPIAKAGTKGAAGAPNPKP
jgi:hypothetical protein